MDNENKRREFLKQISGLGVLALAAGAGIYFAPKLKSDILLLRPPAAVKEDDFLKLCIKCGQCLQVCPYDSIILEDIEGGASLGMAYIDPTKRGCYLCEAFPCVLACPTGALEHEHDNIKYIHMGMAVVINEDACIAKYNKKVTDSMVNRIYDHTKVLTKEEKETHKVKIFPDDSEKTKLQKELLQKLDKFRGKDCSICADLCPYPNPQNAIGMIKKGEGLIPEIRQSCVGCGACVELCPTNVLKIVPRASYDDIYKGKKDV